MLFQLNEAENAFLDKVRAFVAEEVLPKTREWEEAKELPNAIWPRLGELGLLRMTLPAERGGVSCSAYCEAIRELAQGDPALAMNVAAVNALVIAHIDRYGTQAQKDKYLDGAANGTIKLAWGLTEPDAGSDARRVETKADAIDGREGWYRLNGRKMFITNGGKADLLVIIARLNEKELSSFLVETAKPGFEFERRIHTVGVSASYTTQFSLKDAAGWHTPSSFEESISLLYRGRLAIGSMALGISEKAHALALEYSKGREQFNRRLCDMQSVQNMLADSEVEIEASRLLLQKGAALFDAGRPIVKESAIAKLYASETSNRVTNRAIQIHGGRGMTPDFLVEKLWRDAKLTEIGEGCSEIQRLVIAKQILR
ncbi:acyl-CoA dehydrogenase [soil metagenome]